MYLNELEYTERGVKIMGNESVKGLSVNAKTLILILLFVNVGFATKMINKYYAMKESGYIREKTFHEQLQQRVMKSFGSMEEMNKMIADITRQKEEAEKVAGSVREQDEQLKLVNKNSKMQRQNWTRKRRDCKRRYGRQKTRSPKQRRR